MKFQFRFESLLQLYRLRRDQVGAEVGKASAAIEKIDEQLDKLAAERADAIGRSNQSRQGTISVDALIAHGRYDSILKADLRALSETRAKLEHELGRRRQKLVAAEADVKRYERLEEKQRDSHRLEQQRRQQVATDEAATVQFLMKRRKR